MSTKHIIIFDGVCNFCNGAINFIIKHDPNETFASTPMQTELASSLARKHNITDVGLDTLLLVKNGQCYKWTDAVLEITKDLSGYWHLFNILKIIPGSIRDFFINYLQETDTDCLVNAMFAWFQPKKLNAGLWD